MLLQCNSGLDHICIPRRGFIGHSTHSPFIQPMQRLETKELPVIQTKSFELQHIVSKIQKLWIKTSQFAKSTERIVHKESFRVPATDTDTLHSTVQSHAVHDKEANHAGVSCPVLLNSFQCLLEMLAWSYHILLLINHFSPLQSVRRRGGSCRPQHFLLRSVTAGPIVSAVELTGSDTAGPHRANKAHKGLPQRPHQLGFIRLWTACAAQAAQRRGNQPQHMVHRGVKHRHEHPNPPPCPHTLYWI